MNQVEQNFSSKPRNKENKNRNKSMSTSKLYKAFIYVALTTMAISILIPVAWVFMASIKQNSEFYGNPWAIPAGVYFQNFMEAFQTARMGEYMWNSVIVTTVALILLLVIALPAAYVLARYKFLGSKLFNILFMGGLFINVNYIVVPIFLMLVDGDSFLKSVFGSGFLLNNLFVVALVYASTASYKDTKTLPVGLMQLMQAQQAAANYGQLYAGLVLVMLPTLILYIMVQKKLTQGMSLGGLKG